MTDPDEARLQRMDLTTLEEEDSFLDHEDDFTDKTNCFNGLIASTIIEDKNKPKQRPFFEIVTNPGDKVYVSCHLPIPVLILSGQAKRKTSLNKVDTLEEEYLWAMEEAKEWCQLHMTYDEIKVKTAHAP